MKIYFTRKKRNLLPAFFSTLACLFSYFYKDRQKSCHTQINIGHSKIICEYTLDGGHPLDGGSIHGGNTAVVTTVEQA